MDDDTLNISFFSDEAWIHLSGYINSQNTRMWSAENPHYFQETPLHPQKIGVWIALSRRRLIGPIFFHNTISAETYRTEILQPFLNELHDDELRQGFFQQDGARAHTANETIQYLQEYFDDRVISKNAIINFPPRSCDLTPLDFFVWPFIKNSIYKTPIASLQELQDRIIEKCQEINNTPHLLENAINGIRRRAILCLQENGGHFSHLL